MSSDIEDTCVAVFGRHDWHWFEVPVLLHFDMHTHEPLGESFARCCRRCMREEVVYAPAPPPGERILEHR